MRKIDYIYGLALLACVAYIASEKRDHHWYMKLMDYAQDHPEKTMKDFVKDCDNMVMD